MTLRILAFLLVVALGCAGVVALGCAGEVTQLVVVVETNLDVPTEIDEVEVVVTGPSGVSTSTSQVLRGPSDPPFPLTVTVLPSGDALGPVTVVARGLVSGEERVRTDVRTSLVAGRSKMVRLYLLRGCIDRPCDGMTCGLEGCAPVDVSGDELPGWVEGPLTPTDLDDPCSANPWDQDGDGQGDEACGGTDCDDTESRAYLGNVEDCDMVDNDCDGARDEDCACTPEGVVDACPTRCGSTGTHTCSGGVWSPCVAEEICSGSDTDCDGITDEGFAYVEGARAQVTTSGAGSDQPHMIFADGRFAVAWIDRLAGFREGVYFITLSQTGDTEGRTPMLVDDDAQEPRLAWSGSRFGVTWFDPDVVSCGLDCSRTERRVRFTTIDTSGALLSETVELESAASDPVMPRIAWSGSEFGIAYNDNDVTMHRADGSGNLLGGGAPVNDQVDGLDMVHTGASYAFLFVDNRDVFFEAGTPGTFPMASPIYTSSNDVESPSLVETEMGFFGAFADDNGRLVETVVLDSRGAPVTPPRPLTVPLMRDRLSVRPQIAAAPGQVLVVFRAEDEMGAQDMYLARFAPDGRELQAPTRIVIPDEEYWPSPAWGTDRVGIAYIDRQGGDENLWFTSFGCP